MNSDNNQEMFPLVDEQGNIIGAATLSELSTPVHKHTLPPDT